MRLTSDFWVAAFMRQVRGENGFAYLVRRGATEAGAIFIITRHESGRTTLYGPAPQMFYKEDITADERRFVVILPDAAERDVTEKLHKELQFDPDIWIVEIEKIDKLDELLLLVGDVSPS